ncbi:MAG: TMAO reductase system periplasmic protein TorT [Gammaproteobacteria bacterium]|jgi:protein TorT|nr:TMAO reductase system periplasmic protein TorT [Gammaproteobacteria bacterium]
MTLERIDSPNQKPLTCQKLSTKHWLWFCILLCMTSRVQADAGLMLNTWSDPLDYASPTVNIEYHPLADSQQDWHLCALYPHLKDPYWLGVNYGMVRESKRLGIKLTVLEAGGYPQVENQLQQIQQCLDLNADAIVVSAVTYQALESTIQEVAKSTPVIAAVNDMSNPGVSAKVGVSWHSMGFEVGDYLARLHPKGSPEINIAWFPGPKGAGWVKFIESGFRTALSNSSANIVSIKWGDTGKEIQRNLLQETLQETNYLDYIVGTALTADAAVGELLNKGLRGEIDIISTYMTQNVLRGIQRGHILAAPNDAPVLQGSLAIEQAVRVLEKSVIYQHIGPSIKLVTVSNVTNFDPTSVLPPSTFWPTFTVPAKGREN